ncbi:MAG TPA: pyridoxal-dependent decarboxylase [Kofleriaceae bacterium]|nr:pyridoxal-dependent decarboxylase [Kofleriaceae bacterium]
MVDSVESSLDPSNWEDLRLLGHRMVDDMIAYLRDVRNRPVWQSPDADARAAFRKPLPHTGTSPEEIYRDVVDHVLPYPLGNIHPRYWAWMNGTGTPLGMFADMLCSGMNSGAGGGDQIGIYVERQVLDWCKEMLGYPSIATGVVVSGASIANFIGLAVARTAKAGFDVNREGLHGRPQMTVYTSTETHPWVDRMVCQLGLGLSALRRVPVNDAYEMDIGALRSAIDADRRAGRTPICVVATAGAVNTGAFDDLAQLADLCESEQLWLHVDAAFGAWVALTPLRDRVASLSRADSIAVDVHKWMHVPYGCAFALVRHPEVHALTFSQLGPQQTTRARAGIGSTSAEPWPSELGLELGRPMRALKLWMTIREHGVDGFAASIQQNLDQAAYLAEKIRSCAQLEVLAPVTLNIVCFRYRHPDISEPDLNSLNQQLLERLQDSGTVMISWVTMQGRFALRAGICNHRTRCEDLDFLVQEVQRVGGELLAARSTVAR